MRTENFTAERESKINDEQLIKLLRLGFTRTQVCDFFGVSQPGLYKYIKKNFGKSFEALKAECSVQTQSMIMANLMSLSKKNAQVAIFLAKSVCGLNENYSAPVNDDAENAFAGALKKASRNISNAKNLVSIPDDTDYGEGNL